MRWYTAIGMKKDDADGRFCVWVDGEEKILTEMETILWAALTWSFCEEDKVHSQMHRLLVFSLGEKQAQEWADKEDFQFCLNRLVKRGLVVLTEGCTREEAVYSIISRSVMAPMAFSRTERMKHFMEALSMGKGLKFSLRAFKKPLLTEEELICTPFTGHPVKGVFLCVILTNLRKKLLNCIAKENGLMHPMI